MYYIDKANERHEIIFETIWHKSNANSLIVLPYGDYDSVRRGEADEIRFDMAHPLEGISMTYLRCFDNGCKNDYPIFADPFEIQQILDRFFGFGLLTPNAKERGMQQYWFAFYHANYLVWRDIQSNPVTRRNLLEKMLLPDIDKLANHID